MRGRLRSATRVTLALAATLLGAAAPGAPALAAHGAADFAGTALWLTELPAQESAQELATAAAAAGSHTLYIKAADGTSALPQFSPTRVAELRRIGLTVCAWTFVYGADPTAEAAVASAAVGAGAECLIVDAEGQYDGRYGAAQLFVHALRAQLGGGFPIGLAGQAEVGEHPTFPYSVFLAPGAFNADLPQMYWLELGASVDAAYVATIGANAVYGRPISPVGQLSGPPTSAELLRFRSLAGAYGLRGVSFFDLDAAVPQALAALAIPAPALKRRVSAIATLRAGADGDDVVEAQERLNGAGAHLPVGGFYGAITARAVATFQARHRLRGSGVLDPATWRALLRFAPRQPSWAQAPPDSAR